MAEKGRKFLLAIDEGDESMYALKWCLNSVMSENSKDTLILCYVKPPRFVYTSVQGTAWAFSPDVMASIERYSNDVAQCVIDKAKRACKHLNDVKVETVVEQGDPREMICEVAEKLNVDMLVMGSHGYGLIKRAFLGSVSNHCVHNAKCPVLIVKKPKSNGGNDKH